MKKSSGTTEQSATPYSAFIDRHATDAEGGRALPLPPLCEYAGLKKRQCSGSKNLVWDAHWEGCWGRWLRRI